MTPEKLKILEQKFLDYVDRYISNSSEPAPMILKKEHTIRVCCEIEGLVKSLLIKNDNIFLNCNNNILNNKPVVLNSESLLLARTMALFHDIGRFRQFETYRTFSDQKSANHAGLSIIEIDEHDILSVCTEREQSLIKGAIAVHNAAQVPNLDDMEMVLFMKLLRDADKLDIWRVVINNYMFPDAQTQEVISLGLKDHRGCSSEALKSILNHTYVKINLIRELNDLKLMQISWAFDLNFPQSLRLVKERNYIEQLASTLSVANGCDELTNAIECVYDYIKTNS
ncbi:MAG: HD domain-containing protein [Desulfamplus sp.]|nr:HD domain-containing protein [Desulfamplus sp.]MBF0411507.1 HD domain-containing protein [Desulfamplus sp.]